MTRPRPSPLAASVSLLIFFAGVATTGGFDRAARNCASCAFGQTAAPQFERELTAGGAHTYGLKLAAGQFVRAVFDQRGVDVEAALIDPDGRELLRVNAPSGSWGVESLFYEAARGGKYTILVGPAASSAPPGRYEFDIELGDVATTDRRRLAAERSLARAALGRGDGDNGGSPAARYKEALGLFRAASDKRGEMVVLEMAGTVAAATGDAQKALAYFDDLLALQRAAGERRGAATTLGRTGQLFYSLDNKRKALEYFDQALALFRELDDKRMAAYTLTDVGLARAGMTDRREALEAFQNALTLLRAAADKRGEAFVLNQLGLLHDALGERQQSHRYQSELVQLLRTTGNCQELAPALSNLAWATLEADDKRKAVEYLDEALSIQQGIGDRRGEAITLNNLGFVYNSLGDQPKALAHLKRALTLFRELADRQGAGDAAANLMYLWKSGRKTGAAIFYGKLAVNSYQTFRADLPPLDLMAQRSFIKSKKLTYHELADLLVTQGRLLEAQQVIDLLKEQEYLDYVRRDGGNAASKGGATLTPAEGEAGKRYEALAEQLVLRGRQRSELLAKQTRSAEEEQQLARLETELQASGRAFQDFLDRLGEELGNTKQAARVDQLRDSQALMDDLRELGDGAVALYTLVGAEKYRVILITPHVQKAAEYPIKGEELERKVFALREALRDPRSDVRPLAEGLYRILIGPIAQDLKDAQAETLMWSLDGPLRYVPMAALHDGERYVVERYRNVVFTPASNSRLKDASSAKWSAFGAGVTKPHANFSALPGVVEELRGIVRAQEDAPGGVLEGRVLLDDEFTLETFRAGLRQRFPVVHVASHFAVQPGNEKDSFLLLGDGSHLSLSEIRGAVNLFGGVELLTLSACDTATGGTAADGKEVESFAVLAQRQGAKAVMASLWPVADQSTKQLMQDFYRLRNAQPGAGKAEALRQAQLTLLRGAPDASAGGEQQRGIRLGLQQAKSGAGRASYSHPFFWAPFILIGNWR